MDRRKGLTPSPMPPRTTPLGRSARLQAKTTGTRRPDGAFSVHTKFLVRVRAGDGDPDEARCEHCGYPLGWNNDEYLIGPSGDYQHIVARGMGGTSNPLLASVANAALLCRPSHILAESRDPEMEALGFWARQGTDPRLVPMRIWKPDGSRLRVWRGMGGEYLYSAPEGAEAA